MNKETIVHSNPIVSVIMPVYNAEQYLTYAIESVLNQTYSEFELIIINDASTDNSGEIIKKYSDKRIKVITHESNKGVVCSTNEGIEKSGGEYISILDDDDIYEPKKLENQILYFNQNPEIDVVGGRCHFIDEEGKIISEGGVPRYNPKIYRAQLLFYNLGFVNSSVMYRKNFIVENGLKYEDNTYGMQDYLFFVKASKVGQISAISDFIVRYRLHVDNLSKVMKTQYSIERGTKYKEIREFSLSNEGYELDEKMLSLLNKAMQEGMEKVNDFKEWYEVKTVFNEIIRQAKEQHKDYVPELEIVIKKIMVMLLQSFDFLDE